MGWPSIQWKIRWNLEEEAEQALIAVICKQFTNVQSAAGLQGRVESHILEPLNSKSNYLASVRLRGYKIEASTLSSLDQLTNFTEGNWLFTVNNPG